MTLVRMEGIAKTYEVEPPITALRDVALEVNSGERFAIIGKSGAGKSTLLNIIGLLDRASAGTYELAGKSVLKMRDRELDTMRAEHIGFIFQDFHVLPHRTVAQNLELKLAIGGVPNTKRAEMIEQALDTVGLAHRRDALARLLSGGEKQRLSIARAIIAQPELILADEPTGNLDSENSGVVLQLFDKYAALGHAIVVITHDDSLAQWADRVGTLADGVLQGGLRNEALCSAHASQVAMQGER